MKKIIFSLLVVVAIVSVASYNVYNAQNEINLSDLALANVEALADEPEITDPDCPNGCLDDGKGCWCHGYHKDLKEYNWNKPQKEIGQ